MCSLSVMSEHRPAWLEIDWRAHLRWLHVDGRPVNVLDAGPRDGDPIVFIHGHSGCWQHWLENLPAFIDDHRVIALDLPGFGHSEMPDEISMTGYARTVDDVMGQLGVDAACVVGNSMGGFVAAELAIRSPQRVERLVLVSAAGMSGRYIGLPTQLITHPSGAAIARVALGLGGVPDPLARKLVSTRRGRRLAFGFLTPYPDRVHPATMYEYVRAAGRPAGAPSAVALAGYDFKDRVPEIGCPTLVIWGDRDHLVPVRCARLYADAIDGARMVIYERTGHLPMTERPERFNEDLRTFLAEQVSAVPAAAA